MVANLYEGDDPRPESDIGMARTSPTSTAVVTSRTPSSPIRAAPITAKRRKGSSRRGYSVRERMGTLLRRGRHSVTTKTVAYIGNR